MSGDRDFWSRRRAAVQAEQEAEARKEQQAEVEAGRAELEALPDEQVLERLDLPDPDTLQPGDDFAAFLRDVVPERLRRRALRRLWRSNPVLANLDGLNDYDADYTAAATDAPNLRTAYRVGRGLLRHVEALAAEAAPADAPGADAPTGAADADPGPASALTAGPASDPAADPAPDPVPHQASAKPADPDPTAAGQPGRDSGAPEDPAWGETPEDGSPLPRKRRITFSFNG
ncbi:DUF3306 domain-containing protein [Rhodobacteraceae bacterium 2CG4]|uniref:DUF3306 domain-containing protein n=1 Tax=Halovulum marinum TaxID=2662447 RepID=A0A6L5Z237_9RHOB|nr:DUF3306 domain-containing protein [Halovulum marinum]MSU90140.1 DUF3306 domain-containing protein [Halovulum marinum]